MKKLNNKNWHIVCVCVGIGFPHGDAQAKRIRLIAKALLEKDFKFTVLHIGGSPHRSNLEKKGVFDNIQFQYCPSNVERPANAFKRKIMYLQGVVQTLNEIRVIRKQEQNVCVYAWTPGIPGLMYRLLLKMFAIPVVQEVNEWWPGKMEWIIKCTGLLFTDGTIAISKMIEDRLNMLSGSFKISNKIIRIPVLTSIEDPIRSEFPASLTERFQKPYILWCGNIKGYFRDVKFMIHAHRNVIKSGTKCTLVIVGRLDDLTKKQLQDYIHEIGSDEKNVHFPGYVSDNELEQLMQNAGSLLLPLWDDDRSHCRFPTKLGEYLLSGKPVITCRVGDLSDYLIDNESVYFFPPGDVDKFAEKMCKIINNYKLADSIGLQGRLQAEINLNYKSKSRQLADLFYLVSR
ncbi:MAG: glycosyltransferase family 4 protein [Deltaproteobacteria bacterium]|nr:glycosyltransferase family 4 protein [Deltaproteobacteria bacterium]